MHSLPWVVLFAPLVSALIILLVTRRMATLSSQISILGVGVSFLCALALLTVKSENLEMVQLEWLNFAGFHVPIGLIVDPLSQMMMFVVTFIGLLVHVYSTGYMATDPGKARFFAALSLFMFSMLGIVLADNFVMMFIFWELVGVSSYLLIGHWFQKDAPPAAANKAFFLNKIGDFGFMLGILMLWASTGTVVFSEMETRIPDIAAHPAFMTTAAILVFMGAMGKSAQMPLHVWLPDAMEGPTPVSALIHAATMVAAGVYMLARVFFVISASESALLVVGWIGAITCFVAALMATQQNDIKKILAYSTLSQLGYMFIGVGCGSWEAGVFHLYNHAFFKALLFLGAGSVIVAMHHEQDIWKMGALKNKVPATFFTFSAATLAIIGFPFFSGFFSKDAILDVAYNAHTGIHQGIFWLGMITVALTAFYMVRLFTVTFFTAPRSEEAKHAKESPKVMVVPMAILALFAFGSGYPFIAKMFHVTLPAHGENAMLVTLMASGFMLLGLVPAFLLYRNAKKEMISIPLFAHKFYFDEFYAILVRYIQDGTAAVAAWVDRWVINGVFVKGTTGLVYGAGFVLRCLQIGNLQAYGFLFGAGVAVVIYVILFT